MEQSPSLHLTVSHLVKKFTTFYVTRTFITAFTNAHHVSLSWTNAIQSKLPHATSSRSILILSPIYALVSQVVLFPQVSPPNTLYTPLLSPIRATCLAHLVIKISPSNWQIITKWNSRLLECVAVTLRQYFPDFSNNLIYVIFHGTAAIFKETILKKDTEVPCEISIIFNKVHGVINYNIWT
jgi:hypothetical protein